MDGRGYTSSRRDSDDEEMTETTQSAHDPTALHTRTVHGVSLGGAGERVDEYFQGANDDDADDGEGSETEPEVEEGLGGEVHCAAEVSAAPGKRVLVFKRQKKDTAGEGNLPRAALAAMPHSEHTPAMGMADHTGNVRSTFALPRDLHHRRVRHPLMLVLRCVTIVCVYLKPPSTPTGSGTSPIAPLWHILGVLRLRLGVPSPRGRRPSSGGT